MNNILINSRSIPNIKIKYRYLAYLILMYPSVPYFDVGWGSNLPFFFISLIIIYYYFLENNSLKVDKVFIIPLLSFFTISLGVVAVYYRLGDFNFKLLFVGLREYIINLVIIYSILIVYKKVDFNIFFKGLLFGVYFNFFYGLLELTFPTITLYDPFFHELGKEVYKDYFLSGNVERIRLLWTEPSMAGVYMAIFALPLGLFIKKKKEKIFYFTIWTVLFVSIFSKGTILFLFITLIIYSLFNIKQTLNIGLKPYTLGIIFIVIMYLMLNSTLSNKLEYIFTILTVVLGSFINGNFDILGILSTSESISFSQSGRFITIYTTLSIMFHDFYTIITGFTPFGYSYYKYINEDLIPEAFYGLMAYKDYAIMFHAKDSTQSAILEMYGYYGLPIIIFISIIIRRYYKHMKYSNLLKPTFIKIYFIWMFLLLFFMLFYHSLPLIVVLYLLFKKHNESSNLKVVVK